MTGVQTCALPIWINLEDLAGRRQEEYRLTSKGGVFRLLKTTAAESISETPTPVKDALSTVGSAVGTLLGIKRGPQLAGHGAYSKAAEAVLDLASQLPEIRYNQFTVTAIRGADRAIRLAEIAIIAPSERLTGSGEIAFVQGRPLRAQPSVWI